MSFTPWLLYEFFKDFYFDFDVFSDFWLFLFPENNDFPAIDWFFFVKSAPSGFPKSGISNVLSFNWANYKLLNKFYIFFL